MLVSVAVQSDFVACASNSGELLREGFEAVGGREEGRFDVISVVEVQQSVDADCGTEDAAGNIGGVLWAAVAGIDPA